MSKQDVRSYIWDEVESLPRREMERLQVERLRAGIDRVSKTVPFYKNKLSEAGVTADSIRSFEDLDRLPFTTKTDLRDNYPFGLVAVPLQEVIRLHASSGTTGKPTVVAYTRNDITLWADLMARTFAAAGATADHMDELDVLVEAPAQICSNQERLVQLEKRLSYDVQSALGITCKVKLVGPREIPRSEGKAVRVVDKRKM
jgi:phenylacetate-coenzyme A ligase PaaK-like adenylate-forming protein